MSTLCNIISKHGGLIQTGPFGSQLHEYEYVDVGVPVVMPKDIVGGRINYGTIARVSEEKASQLHRHKLQAGDIVFPRRGDIGKCAFVSKNDVGCLCGTGCLKITAHDAVLSPRFLFYFLGLPESVKWLENNSTGSTMMNLNTDILGRIEIPDLPIEQQRRIADVLSAYDDLIENNRRRIAILEEMARLTYRKWFGMVEEGRTTTLGEIAPFVRGKVITQKNAVYGEVPVVAGGLDPAYFHNVANTGVPVITISGSGANAGFTRMYFEAIWASDCSWCDKSKTKYFYFAYCFLKDNADALRNLQQGAAQPHVYSKDINALEVALPKSDDLLDEFEEVVEPLFSQCGVLAKQNAALAAACDMLLPRLMKGGCHD